MVLTSDNKNLIICDGYEGLKIYNVEKDLMNPIYISGIRQSGWTVHMKLIQNDNYILVTTQ